MFLFLVFGRAMDNLATHTGSMLVDKTLGSCKLKYPSSAYAERDREFGPFHITHMIHASVLKPKTHALMLWIL